MRQIILFFTVFCLCSSCRYYRYPGFKYFDDEIYYSLIQVGEKDEKPFPGDFLTAILSYKTVDDSLFFHGTRKFRYFPGNDRKSAGKLFSIMSPGDSVIFLISSELFFKEILHSDIPLFLKGEDMMRMEVRLLGIQTSSEYELQKKEFLEWIKDMDEKEDRILSEFLKNEGFRIPPTKEGFYMITLNKGSGRYPREGDHIWISYTGRFLNGEFFDDSVSPDVPMDFIFGTKMYLVEGLEKAIPYMSEGEKAMIILPSALAFGAEGSAEGLIPPYTSLIYELSLIRIK